MKHAKRTIKNTLQNALLVVMVLMMGAMMLLNWSITLEQAGITPTLDLWEKASSLLGDGGYERRAGDAPAAYPIRMSITNEQGKLVGIAYNESMVSSFYTEIAPLFASALEQAGKLQQATESDLTEALQTDTVMMQYSTDMPLQLLKGWVDASKTPDFPQAAEMLLLTRDGKLFLRSTGQDGTLYRADVKVDSAKWKKAQKAGGTAVHYAGQDTAYQSLYPESLVLSTPARYDVLQRAIPKFGTPSDTGSIKALLEAFGYSTYAQHDTEDNGQTQVFVENYSTLEVSSNGHVYFRATSMTGGLSAYQEKDDEVNPLAAQVDFSQQLLTSVLRAIGSNAGTTLQKASEDTDVLQFSQTVNGVPVQMGNGHSFARFTYQKGVLISAEFWLRNYSATGEKLYVLPEKQAAAAVTDARQRRYQILYTDNDGSTRVTATACLQ